MAKADGKRRSTVEQVALDAERQVDALLTQDRPAGERQALLEVRSALETLRRALIAEPHKKAPGADSASGEPGQAVSVPSDRSEASRAPNELISAAASPASGLAIAARETRPASRTDEQDAIVDSRDRELAVNAFAGTGKTFTLVEYARARPRARILYLAFNKSIAAEAQRRFGPNVKSQTSHSLAFGQAGRQYVGKLGNPRARDVLELLQDAGQLPVLQSCDEYVFAQSVLQRVRDFFADGTLDPEITDAATPASYRLPSGAQLDGREVARAARRLWEAMRDPASPMRLPHDAYLKLYQLSRPDLSRYDVVLLDEAQDTTPAVLSIVQAQRTGKVLVGDRWQGIYGFRGSLNAMARMKDARQFALTKSFRFGPKVAYVANVVLAVFGGERRRLIGAGTHELPEHPSVAQLHRTNAGLFGAAAGWLTATVPREAQGLPSKDSRGEPQRGLHFVGGVESYQLDQITDTWQLRTGAAAAVADPFIRKFASYDLLLDYATAVDDRELLARIGIVEQFQHRIPELVARVKAAHVPAEAASIELSTAHRAKGLEWDRVQLGDDFPELLSESGVPRTRRYLNLLSSEDALLPQEEANLFYVSATRARCVLEQNPQLSDFLDWCRAQREAKQRQDSEGHHPPPPGSGQAAPTELQEAK